MTEPSTTEEILAFPASVAQQSFWYLELLDKNVSAFNVPLRYRIDGPLDATLLEKALLNIADRHEILRTHFEEEEGELLQVVEGVSSFHLTREDISGLPENEREAKADRLGDIEGNRHFNLGKGPLFRAELIRLAEQRHHLHVTFHHAIFDGLSIGNFVNELRHGYEALVSGTTDDLPPLPIQYGDFSVWQKEALPSAAIARQLDWWKEKLAGMTEPELPTDRPRPSRKSWKGSIIKAPVPAGLTEKLQAIANRRSATLFHLQLAAFKVLLHRYTGATDIPVGTPVSGRTRGELEPLIGVFINSLILRSDLSGDPTFDELLGRVRDTAVQAIEHQDLPFENIVRALKPERDPGRNPLFQINFSQDRFSPKPVRSGPVTISHISSASPGCIFDLHLFMAERDGAWQAGCDFSTDLFDRSTIERLLQHYLHLLEQISRNPDERISRLELLTEAESSRILGDWSAAPSVYPRDETVAGLFHGIAGQHPAKVALIHGDKSTTYGELDRRALAVASKLRASGLAAGDLVAVSSPPTADMIAALLGILMAGGAYVPLNPADPAERSKLLLEECGARFLLSDTNDGLLSSGTWLPLAEAVSSNADAGMEPGGRAGDAAYLMFTSGSTGTPKGVLVPHRAIVRLVKDANFLPIGEEDVFLHAAPASFDASTLEIWGPLLNGASLVLPGGGTSLDQIASCVRNQGVTILWLTSGLFNLMVEEHAEALSGLKYLLAGGDVLSMPHVRKAMAALPLTTLVNGYGPTENTTFTTCHTITRGDLNRASIPIGRPVSNTTVFVLDASGNPVPPGIPGELHTGGDGLAIGYHRDAALTAEKFITHPRFGRLYRTGDRCRWTVGGVLEFIGRTDHQVKVRGFRIEPGEIEAVLGSHPEVRLAKVAVRGDDSGSKRILAWVQPAPGASPTPAVLRTYLAGVLPAFMCPDAIGLIDRFPITANGKIDSRTLPDPQAEKQPAREHAPPTGGTEQRLARIWSDLLGIPDISRNDEFFALGGHSLMALRMFSRLNREFDRSLPLSALISHPTVGELAVLLEPDRPAPVPEMPGTGLLVPLSQEGSQPPLVCIHGGDGGVLFYRELAALLPADIPVYAIESMELSNSGPITPMSIGETATAYVRTLLAAHPQGPFRLAGYSFGGVVAHEMACLLQDMGHTVEFLGLLDTHNPAAPHVENNIPRRIATFWKNNSDTPLAPRVVKLAARFADGVSTNRRVRKEEEAASTAPAEAHGDLRRVQVRQENWRAMQAYQPRPFAGKISLFKAKEQGDNIEWPEDYGWREHALGGFEIVPVAGKHLTLFDPENVRHLAEKLTPRITGKGG
ncbi:amino acid adenylation domain-containing protein [Luteolibacter sp. SL250]|uniref:non-ribosomal peptide synthetase n=1 Tax=Luteolibacter sp. SL250 TaxID=2995170 RepID=UPI002271F120|nr:non-ribosomal peptide synthetase [Luteolibacter sp. SL250]WAC19373.1 amino acid adenylation domain-containing protein [Luteolibacter sp. SL250]